MLDILIIDGQGGKIGGRLVETIKALLPETLVTAIGTNSTASEAMLRAGADRAATGENSVVVCSRTADIIMGPVGIISTDSMLGEITEKMAVAIGRSPAKKLLIPMNMCDIVIAGMPQLTVSALIDAAVEQLRRIICEP